MPPAARLGDQTGHGTPLGPGVGCSTVLIGGQPAWRATADTHVCPLANGAAPHAGGVEVKGSSTVLIGGMPAARMGDQIIEAGGPAPIVTGCATVMIGG